MKNAKFAFAFLLLFSFALSSCQQTKENVKSQDAPKTQDPVVQSEDGYVFNVASGQVWNLKDGSDLFISFVDMTDLTEKDVDAKNFFLNNYSGRVQMLAGKYQKISDTSYKLITKDRLKFNLSNMNFAVIYDTENTKERVSKERVSIATLQKCTNCGSCYGIDCMDMVSKCYLGPHCTHACARCGFPPIMQ